MGHIVGDRRYKIHLLRVAIVVVQRQEPVTLFHVMSDFFLHGGLLKKH